jgi:TPR repeat protein
LRIVYEEIFSFLPVLSKKGSGDDISLAGIIDINKNRILAIRYYIRGIKNIGIPSGNTAGHKLLKKAADLGYEKAQYEYGCLCYNKSSQHKMCEQRLLSKSQQYLEEAKENGVKEATILLNEIFGTAFQNRLNDMEERIDVEIQSRSEK